MAGSAPGIETEIKIRLESGESAISRLEAAAFRIAHPRIFEANTVYDDADSTLRTQGRLLRIREVGDRTILTYKGPADRGKHKSREERETSVGDAQVAAVILDRLGFAQTFRYEKYRAEYERPGESGVVTLDETPIGWFMELEGPPDWIDRTAASLGFLESEYLTDSYGSLYLKYCEELGISPTNMVFIKTP